MPAYTFENIKTGEEYTIHMPMSEIDDYLKKNKNIRQVFTTLNIVGGVAGITYKMTKVGKRICLGLQKLILIHHTQKDMVKKP